MTARPAKGPGVRRRAAGRVGVEGVVEPAVESAIGPVAAAAPPGTEQVPSFPALVAGPSPAPESAPGAGSALVSGSGPGSAPLSDSMSALAPPRPVDHLDRRIILFLQKDGRMANTAIARQLNVTETTVRKRVARLVDSGLINIVAVPTPLAVGMNLSAIVGVSVNPTDLRAASEALHSYPEVRYVGLSSGRYDIIVEAFFIDQEHLLDFVSDKLGALPGVATVETSIILKVVKFSYEWEIT